MDYTICPFCLNEVCTNEEIFYCTRCKEFISIVKDTGDQHEE